MSAQQLLEAIAARPAEAPILVGGGNSWRKSEVLAAIAELGARLAGIRTLATLADNSPAWVMADLAAIAAGTAHLPLPTFFSGGQLAHVLDRTGAELVLTDQPERIAALGLGFSCAGDWLGLSWMRRPSVPASLPPGTAKISFTSGSTGSPKGACLSSEGLVATAGAICRRLSDLPIRRHLATLPLSLLLENTAGIYAALLRGAEIHLPGLQSLGWQGMAGFAPRRLQEAVERLQPSSMILVPELLKAWSLYLEATGLPPPASLTYAAVGGARVDAAALGSARALGIPAYQGYGLTECGSVVSLNRPGDDGDDVGRPLDHVAIRAGEGEILVSAPAFLGYLGIGSTDGAGGEFATGDLGHLDAHGHLHLAGRRKNLLITSFGRNVAPEWIEAGLLAQAAVAQAIVAGDSRPWLCAVLVPAAGVDAAGLAAAIARANAALPDYARIRRWLAAPPFTLDNGQATGNGRPVRAAILDRHAAALAALYSDKEPADVFL